MITKTETHQNSTCEFIRLTYRVGKGLQNMHDPKVTTPHRKCYPTWTTPRGSFQLTLPLSAYFSTYQGRKAMLVRVELHTDLQGVRGEQPESQ